MMGNGQTAVSGHDRRHAGRATSSGTALVRGPTGFRGRIIDLAVGGLRLLVEPATRAPDVGTHVRLDVRLDGRGGWLRLIGKVVRVEPRGSVQALVIELLVVPADFEDLVQDELLAAVECAHPPHVLLVDPDQERREAASEPLDAIAAIDHIGTYARGGLA